MKSEDQPQLDFSAERGEEGYNQWREQRRLAMRTLAAKLGLPLERKVEIWLRGDIRLIGVLSLREQLLFVPENNESRIELVVDNVPFTPNEIVSTARLD